MRKNRRKVLVGAGAAMFGAAGIGAGQSVLADNQGLDEEDDVLEGDVSLDTTVEYTETYLEYQDNDEIDIECPDCADPHDIDEIKIETATQDHIAGEVTITQACSHGDYNVAVTLKGLRGSVPIVLRCYEVATVEFAIEPAEPLDPGEYEIIVTVESGEGEEEVPIEEEISVWNEERESFEITGDDTSKGLDKADEKAGEPKEREEKPGNHGRDTAREKQKRNNK
jgi:hypothetical protein